MSRQFFLQKRFLKAYVGTILLYMIACYIDHAADSVYVNEQPTKIKKHMWDRSREGFSASFYRLSIELKDVLI
jgi:hypothetical protein